MKRIISVILALAVSLSMVHIGIWAANDGVVATALEAAESFAGGDGTESAPYLIETAGQLKLLADKVNEGDTEYSGAYYLLTADIDLEGGEDNPWTPIGIYNYYYDNKPFSGTFDGDGHLISGLFVNITAPEPDRSDGRNPEELTISAGLFGAIDTDSTVENLGVAGSVISEGYNVGGIVGHNDGGTVENCYFTGDAAGYSTVGGIVGENAGGTVKDCHNTGKVSGEWNDVAGIVGSNISGAVQSCYNTGEVSGWWAVAGIAGENINGTVQSCYNTGNITNNEEDCTGGIVGENRGTVQSCYNTGEVTGWWAVGGIAGENRSTVQNCYNTGDVIGTDSVGGVAGYNNVNDVPSVNSTVQYCYNTGEVISTIGSGYIGSVVGTNASAECTVEKCFYLNTINDGLTGIGVGAGKNDVTGIDTAEFARHETFIYADWDFDDVWKMNAYLGRPVFIYITEITGVELEGSGTSTDPYLIKTAEDLAYFAALVNGGFTLAGKFFELTDDIDLSDVCGEEKGSWTPIGTYSTETRPIEEYPFSGTFDGNGHMITGLYIDSTDNYQGLFGYVCGGVIQNLGVDGYVKGNAHVGGIVGCLGSENIGVPGAGTVKNCYYTGSVECSSENYGDVGGIVGKIGDGVSRDDICYVENCYNAGNVSGTRDVGGIIGYTHWCTIQYCYNSGNVSGTSYNVGGIFGYKTAGTVQNCYNTGNVEGNGDDVGGVAGTSEGTLTNCYNTGEVKSNGNSVGGIVGRTYQTQNIVQDCYNTGKVSGNDYVGGVVGYNSTYGAELKNCYSIGSVEGSSNVGGVIGYNCNTFRDSTVQNCFFLKNTTVNNELSDNGVGNNSGTIINVSGIDEAALANPDTFTDWDFNTVWKMNGLLGRPILIFIPEAEELEGSGTSADPYLIKTAEELALIVKLVNGGNTLAGKFFELADDIDLSDLCGEGIGSWTPIGGKYKYFKGSFDGGGHTISGLYIDSTGNYQGLFGNVYEGTIKNLGVDGSITNTGGNFIGGVVGYAMDSTIQNCFNSCDVSTAGDGVGGITGVSNNNTIQNCYNTGDVSGTSSVGGIVGVSYYPTGTVQNCYNTGNVRGTGNIGGVAGELALSSTVQDCYNIGNVSGTGSVGGIVGDNSGSTVQNCYYLYGTADGAVNGSDTDGAVSKTAAQFNSGEAAYLLQDEQEEQVWYQQLTVDPKDDYPVLSGDDDTVVLQLTYILNGEEAEGYLNPEGTVHVDKDDSVTLNDTAVILPEGGEMGADGNLIFPEGGSFIVKDTVVSVPEDTTLEPADKVGVKVPAETEVEFEGGPEVTLPDGGVIDKDGNIVGGTVEVGGTEVTAPDGNGVFSPDGKGNVYVPDGSTVILEEDFEITVGDNNDKTTVDKDGNIHLPDSGTINIGDTTITAPEGGGTIEPQGDGTVKVSAGSTVGDVVLEEDGHVDKDGKLILSGDDNGEGEGDEGNDDDGDNSFKIGNTTIIPPEGEKVTENEDGTVTVPDGSVVKTPGAPDITVGENSGETTVDKDGNVTVPENGSVEVGGTTVTIPEGGTVEPDTAEGVITVPAGSAATISEGETIQLPDGGTVDSDGNVTPNSGSGEGEEDEGGEGEGDDDDDDNSFKIGNTTIIPPEGEKVTENEDGTVTVPDGSVVKTPGAPDIIVGENNNGETVVNGKGNVTVPEGGSVEVGGTTVTLPEGGTIEPNEDNTVTVPAGSTATTSDGETIQLPDGGTVDSDGNVTPNSGSGEGEEDEGGEGEGDDDDGDNSFKIGNTTIIPPEGEKVTENEDGTVTAPENSVVIPPNGPEMTLPDGGIVDSEGNVTLPDGGKVEIGDTIITVPENGTVKPDGDGNVIVPEDSVVTPPNGPEMTLTDGGIVDSDGNVTLPNGGEVEIGDTIITVPENGTIEPNEDGTVTIPAGSTVEIDGETVTVPEGGAVYDLDDGNLTFNGNESGDNEPGTTTPPDTTTPETTTPGATTPETTAPETTTPGTTVPDTTTAPDTTAPGTAAPDAAVPDSSNVTVDSSAPGVSIDEESAAKLKEEVIANHLTAEEKAAVENGASLEIILSAEIAEATVSEVDKQTIETIIANTEYIVGRYLSIELLKVIDGQQVGRITELNTPISIIIDVPEELIAENRVFAIVRVHDGIAEILEDQDNDPDTITVITDRFSTYAIVYRDAANAGDEDKNQATGVLLVIAPFIAAAAGVIISKKRK